MTAQWVQLGEGETLVATRGGACLQPRLGIGLSLWSSMPSSIEGSRETTRHLLDGAIAAAERAADRQPERPFTPSTWALSLVDQWYVAHHSVALLAPAIERYRSIERPELALMAERKLEEESGHELLPLNDLSALGYDARGAVASIAPTHMAEALIRYARGCVSGDAPVSFFGYIYALERRVIRISDEALGALDAALPAGVDATSGVRAHAHEFDHGHVEELVEFINGLPAADRTEIALSCHATAKICCAAPTDDRGERQRALARFHSTIPIRSNE